MTTDPYTTAPVETPAAMPPAGWYPDPQGAGGQRWWDGTQWTDRTADAQAAMTAPVTAGRKGLSTGAIVAIVAGAVVLLVGLVVVGILIAGGVKAVTEAASEPAVQDTVADARADEAADITEDTAAPADDAQDTPADPQAQAALLEEYAALVRDNLDVSMFEGLYSDIEITTEAPGKVGFHYTFTAELSSELDVSTAEAYFAGQEELLEATAFDVQFPEMRAFGLEDPLGVTFAFYAADGTELWARSYDSE